LFYQTLTGQVAPAQSFDLKLKDVLPCVCGSAYESYNRIWWMT